MTDPVPPKPRVGLDTNVLIAGIAFPRWPREVLQHALAGDFITVLAPTVIAEAQRRIKLSFPKTGNEN